MSSTAETVLSPSTSVTCLPRAHRIFSLSWARCCMIFDARSSGRRWTTVTVLANRVRKVASSIAESPPPTTTMSWSRKKKPSQVAQAETPRPSSRASFSRPRYRYLEPVATMTAWARCTSSPTLTIFGSTVRSTSVTSRGTSSAPKRSAWVRMSSMSCGPWMPSGKPGKFSTSVVVMSAPPNCEPSNTSGCRFARAA